MIAWRFDQFKNNLTHGWIASMLWFVKRAGFSAGLLKCTARAKRKPSGKLSLDKLPGVKVLLIFRSCFSISVPLSLLYGLKLQTWNKTKVLMKINWLNRVMKSLNFIILKKYHHHHSSFPRTENALSVTILTDFLWLHNISGRAKLLPSPIFYHCYILSYWGVTRCNSICVCHVSSKQALKLQYNFQQRKQCQVIFCHMCFIAENKKEAYKEMLI